MTGPQVQVRCTAETRKRFYDTYEKVRASHRIKTKDAYLKFLLDAADRVRNEQVLSRMQS